MSECDFASEGEEENITVYECRRGHGLLVCCTVERQQLGPAINIPGESRPPHCQPPTHSDFSYRFGISIRDVGNIKINTFILHGKYLFVRPSVGRHMMFVMALESLESPWRH